MSEALQYRRGLSGTPSLSRWGPDTAVAIAHVALTSYIPRLRRVHGDKTSA